MSLSPPQETFSVGRRRLNDDRRDSSAQQQLYRSVPVISLCCCICSSEGLAATNIHLHFLCRCFHAPRILCWVLSLPVLHFVFIYFFTFFFLSGQPTQNLKKHLTINEDRGWPTGNKKEKESKKNHKCLQQSVFYSKAL